MATLRFDILQTCGGHCAEMDPDENGDWVRAEDYLKLLDAVQRLERRGWFVPNGCADSATASDMALLLTVLESAK